MSSISNDDQVTPASESNPIGIRRDATRLTPEKQCPACQANVDSDAVLCIQCGYNFLTGKKVTPPNWFQENKKMVIWVAVAVLLLLTAFGVSRWLNRPVSATPIVASVTESIPSELPVVKAEEAIVAVEEPPVVLAEEVVIEVPPPGPTPEELAAKEAEAAAEREAARLAAEEEAARRAFEAKKDQARDAFRTRLDAQAPIWNKGEKVELLRKNGTVNSGTYQGLFGPSTNRVARVETVAGRVDVPLGMLKPESRSRLDAEFRNKWIDYLVDQRFPVAPQEESVK